MKLVASLMLLLVLGGWASAAPQSTDDQPPPVVGVANLLESAHHYAGRSVTVHGFVVWEYEGNAIYASEDDYRSQRYERGVWVDRPPLTESEVGASSGKLGYVTGRFDPHGRGHLGLWGGAITEVTAFAVDPYDLDAPRPGGTHPHFMFLVALLCLATLMLALLAQGVLNRRVMRL
ncbi:MAG: hypothetical protein ACK4E3_05740 [Brevundimonas sp.]|uniref:hypothetical protein n=1 Tax=Brevundimonas sp. TaxID=1871086 RepID=UPI00391ACD73